MPSGDSPDVTLAHVDPVILSCWEGLVKQGQDCSLLLKHSKGKVTATLQSVKPIPPSSSSFSSTSAKRKKKNGDKKKKLDKLLAYHQRLVVEKGLPPSRLMEEHAAASSSAKKKFKCHQCDFETESQRGLKVHIGRSHKDTEILRSEELEVSLVASDPGDVERVDDPSVNADNSFTGAEKEISLEPAHPHSVWVVCPKAECKVKKMRSDMDIKAERPCTKCGAKKQDDCECNNKRCEDCEPDDEDIDGKCCSKCDCCDSRHDPVTERETLLHCGSLKEHMQWLAIDQLPGFFGSKTETSLHPKS